MKQLLTELAFLLFAAPLLGQGFTPGDVLLDGPYSGPPTPEARLLVLHAGSNVPAQVISTTTAGYFRILVDRAGYAYLLRTFDIQKVDAAGNVLGTWTRPVSIRSAVFRADGALVVTHGSDSRVEILDSNGNTIQSFDTLFTGSGDEIDLAADQCTLYVAGGLYVSRYDICRQVRLPDLTQLADPTTDLRLLASGDLLVATAGSNAGDGLGSRVYRLSPTGVVLRTYAISSSKLAVSSDGGSFWVVSFNGGSVSQVDLSAATVLRTLSFASFGIQNVGVVGEPRAAINAAVPALSPFVLGALALLLIMIAAFRLQG